MIKDFVDALGNFFVWTFETLLEPLGNFPNLIFFLAACAGAIYWMMRQKKFNDKAKSEGGYL